MRPKKITDQERLNDKTLKLLESELGGWDTRTLPPGNCHESSDSFEYSKNP